MHALTATKFVKHLWCTLQALEWDLQVAVISGVALVVSRSVNRGEKSMR